MEKFRNFMEAQATAQEMALDYVHQDSECLAFVFIRARKAGKPYSEQERNEMRFLYYQSIEQAYRNYLEGFILKGLVTDCILSRRFMAQL